ALRQLLPRPTAVRGFEQATAATAEEIVVFPWPFSCLPQRGINRVGMRRIKLHVRAARIFVFVENFLPALTAVGGAEDPALCTRTVGPAQHRGIDPVGIARVNGDGRNLLAFAQAKSRPCLTRVSRTIDAVADREIRAMQSFASRYVNHVGIG